MEWAIIYMRPDGWWCAGVGFESPDDAVEHAQKHEWRGSKWGICPQDLLEDTLCSGGWAAIGDPDEEDDDDDE